MSGMPSADEKEGAMKNKRMSSVRSLLMILGIFCMVCLLPLKVSAADEQLSSLSDVYVTGFFGETMAEQQIHWQEDDGDYYLCMPSASELGSVNLYFEGSTDSGAASGYVVIGGVNVSSGTAVDLSAKTVELGLADDTVTIKILQSANIPSVFIATESGNLNKVHASKENKEPGTIQIVKADKTVDYDGTLKQIKGRGNATWGYAKKPYNIKLNKAAPLLGLGEEKGFCLLANYTDYTLLRNRIVYDLAEEVGIPFTMDARSIDLYINGNYMGNYLLIEKVEIGENVVDIVNLEKATEKVNDDDLDSYSTGGTNSAVANTSKWVNIPNDPEDITGGYLLEMELNDRYPAEISGFVTTGGQAVVIKYPEYASQNQVNYISTLYQELEDAMYSDTGYNSLGKHYSEYIDVESFARMYAIQEFAMNLDVGITSFYLYKDSDLEGDGKIHAAPVWDFDRSLGNYSSRNGVNLTDPTKWYATVAKMYNNSSKLQIMGQLMTFDEMKKEAAKIWESDFKAPVAYLIGEDNGYQPNDLKTLDAYAEEIEASVAMNYVDWDPLSIISSGTDVLSNTGLTFEENMDYLTSFIVRRAAFMTEEMDAILYPPVVQIASETTMKAAKKIVSSATIQTEECKDEDGGESLGYCDAGAYAEYNIEVAASGKYDLSARTASQSGGGAFDVIVDGTTIASFTATRTGGWQNWATLDAQEVRLEKGSHTLRIEFTQSGSNLNWLKFVLTEADPEEVQLQLSKDKLQAMYDAYKAVDTSVYTAESAAVLETALEEAEVLLNAENASTKEISDAIIRLMNAYAGLEYGVAKLHLETVIEIAEGILEDRYGYDDLVDLSAAVAVGKMILEDEDAAQAEVDQAANDIIDELAKLEINKDFLRRLIEAAKTLEESDAYAETKVEALREAVAAGEVVLEDTQASAEAINSACRAILNAIAALESEQAPPADPQKETLRSLIDASKEMAAGGTYSEETTEALNAAIADAEAVLENTDSTSADLTAAAKALLDAVAGLQEKTEPTPEPDKGDLEAVTMEAEAILADKDAYVAESLEGLEALVAKIKELSLKEGVTQEEIDAAKAELENAVAKAWLLGDVNQDGVVNTSDATELLRASAELTTLTIWQQAAGDVDRNGTADTYDVVLILKYAAEMIDKF